MKKSSLATNAILNTIKQCLTILFPLITFPYISRILGTSYYGRYNFSLSIVSYFSMIASLGIPTYSIKQGSQILGKDKIEAFTFYNEVFSINIMSMIISYLALIACVFFIPSLSEYRVLILIQSLSILFTTISADWINTIYEDFKYLTIRYVIIQILSLILMFVFIREPEDYILYAWITVFANSVAGLLNVFYIRRYAILRFTIHVNLRKHIKPIMVLFLNLIAISVYINSDVTMIGLYRTESEVGIYSASVKIYNLVKQLINAMNMVVIPRIAFYIGKNEHNQYQMILNNTIKHILFIGTPAFVGLFIVTPDVLAVVSGASYIVGQTVLRILSVSMIFAVISCFFVNVILIPNNKEQIAAIATVISAIINISLNFFTIPCIGIEGAAITTLLAEAVVMLISDVYSKKFWKCDLQLRFIYKIVIGIVIMLLIGIVTSRAIENLHLRLIFVIFFSALAYGIVEVLVKNEITDRLIQKFKKFSLGSKGEDL